MKSRIAIIFRTAIIFLLLAYALADAKASDLCANAVSESVSTGAQEDSVLVAPFAKGDRAVFVGNSITHSGHYHSYIWLYYMTRFPDMPITIVNAGIGGDAAPQMLRRLDADILSADPTVIMFTFGMNDTGYPSEVKKRNRASFAQSKYDYAIKYFDPIAEAFNELPFARIVMVGTSPYDEDVVLKTKVLKGKNANMQRLISYQEQTARDNGWEFVDFNQPMVDINRRIQVQNPEASISGPHDRIHPDNDGDMVMAYLFLKAQGMSGLPVATVGLDMASRTLTESVNCQVDNLRFGITDIDFDYLACSLPYPTDKQARGGKAHSQSEGLQHVPFVDEMNQEILRISGLTGLYNIYIDGALISQVSATQLDEGVNLASLTNTPMYRQAERVMRLNEERWGIEYGYRKYRWCVHTYMYNKDYRDAPPAEAAAAMYAKLGRKGYLPGFVDAYVEWTDPVKGPALQKRMDELISQIYTINRPVPHHFTIAKAP